MNYFIRKIVLLLILSCAVVFSLSVVESKPVRAQAGNLTYTEPEDLILVAVFDPGGYVLSEGILGVQFNGMYYLPALELAEIFEFAVDFDEGRRYLTGWYLSPENTFSIDARAMTLTHLGEESGLGDEDILGEDISPFPSEMYVAVETLNQMWPAVRMTVDLSRLQLYIEAQEDLPFQLRLERKKKREIIMGQKSQKKDLSGLEVIENEYKFLGLPTIDFQAQSLIDGENNNHSLNVTGVQDLAGTTADFGIRFERTDGEFKRPDNARLRLRRIAMGDEDYFLGVREIKGGDIRLKQRNLVENSMSGRGVGISTKPLTLQGEFDVVTIEGVAPAGWEIELYRNNELLEFGRVEQDGLYRFEDIQLFYGNNEIRAILYGPEGQVREDVYNYNFNNEMVTPGEVEFYAGALDTNEDFIPIDQDDNLEAEGLTATGYAFYGLNKRVTLFAGGSQLPVLQEDKIQKYASGGAIVNLPIGLAQVEAYNQLGKGEAIEAKFLTDFFGTKINLQAAKYNQFESPSSGFGNNAKDKEASIEAGRNFRLPFGTLSLRGEAEHRENVDGSTRQQYTTQQSLTWRGLRLSNRTLTQVTNSQHAATSGQINANYRLRRWRFRPSLNYTTFPSDQITSATWDMLYQLPNEYSIGFQTTHGFQTARTTSQLTFSKEFEKFLASVQGEWDSEEGLSMTLRASTSLGPYGPSRDYIVSRDRLSSLSPVQARVFLDNDYDGLFTAEEDDPVEGARIWVGNRRSSEKTDADGKISANQNTSFQNTPIYLDESSVADPYYKSATEGFYIQPRPGTMPSVNLPLIQTGAIDGTVYYDETGNPVEGLTLQLLDRNGKVLQEVETAYDGFYTFEFVPPGTYTIQADPSYDINIPPEQVVVDSEELYYSGVDLSLLTDEVELTEEGWGGLFGPFRPGEEPVIEQQLGDDLDKMPFGPVLPEPNTTPSEEPISQPYGPYLPGKEPDEAGLQPNKMPTLQSAAPPPGAGGTKAAVKRVRIGEHARKIRVVLDLTGPVDYSTIETNDGKTVIVDLPAVAWGATAEWDGQRTPILSHYYTDALDQGGTRFVLEAHTLMQVQSSGILAPQGDSGYRLYIDLVGPQE